MKMARITECDECNLSHPALVVGPAFTGKSTLSHKLLDPQLKTAIIGTATLQDKKFQARVSRLQDERSPDWDLFEPRGSELLETLKQVTRDYDQVLIDSMNQWLASFLLQKSSEYSSDQIEQILVEESQQLCHLLQNNPTKKFVLVSSEVGSGLGPASEHARVLRLVTCELNRKLSELCSTVILVSSGIPIIIKES